MSAAGSQRVRRPSRLLLAAEVPRALGELALLQAARPLLAGAPRGDGHPVLVLPGLAADDARPFRCADSCAASATGSTAGG
jgi:hypothetical protein